MYASFTLVDAASATMTAKPPNYTRMFRERVCSYYHKTNATLRSVSIMFGIDATGGTLARWLHDQRQHTTSQHTTSCGIYQNQNLSLWMKHIFV